MAQRQRRAGLLGFLVCLALRAFIALRKSARKKLGFMSFQHFATQTQKAIFITKSKANYIHTLASISTLSF